MVEQVITAVDVGSSKVFGITALVRENSVDVLGAHDIPSADEIVKKGRVQDVDRLKEALFDLLEELRKLSKTRIDTVVLGVGGGHVKGWNVPRKMELEPRGRVIEASDIENLERMARSAFTNASDMREIRHCISQEYSVDGSTTRVRPVGRRAHTLEARIHILTQAINPVLDIENCIRGVQPRIEILDIYPHAWAAAAATVTDEERKLGCLVVDFGKGTTDIAVYNDHTLLLTESFKLGSGNVDVDLGILVHTPLNYAEELKKDHGWCDFERLVRERDPHLTQKVDILSPAGKRSDQTTVEEIARIVHARVDEIFRSMIKVSVESVLKTATMGGGIIITGGSSRLKGLTSYAEELFGQRARVGLPRLLPGLDKRFAFPEYASGIGMLLLASKAERPQRPMTPWRKLLRWWREMKERWM